MGFLEEVSTLPSWEDWLAVRMELRVEANSRQAAGYQGARPSGEGTEWQGEKWASPCRP